MDKETLLELIQLGMNIIAYLSLGMVLSIIAAFIRKGEDKFWWAIMCVFFPVMFVAMLCWPVIEKKK